MQFSPYIRQRLQEQCGHEFRTSADCESLSLDIESKTGEPIGVNTLKRLLGYINDERSPRLTTLDIIARYLGFDNWEHLKVFDDKSNSSFGNSDDELTPQQLASGDKVEVSYLPDRLITMEYIADQQFRVLESQNSKLKAGDLLTLTHFIKGYPLLVSKVIRDGQNLGSYMAGKALGIKYKRL